MPHPHNACMDITCCMSSFGPSNPPEHEASVESWFRWTLTCQQDHSEMQSTQNHTSKVGNDTNPAAMSAGCMRSARVFWMNSVPEIGSPADTHKVHSLS